MPRSHQCSNVFCRSIFSVKSFARPGQGHRLCHTSQHPRFYTTTSPKTASILLGRRLHCLVVRMRQLFEFLEVKLVAGRSLRSYQSAFNDFPKQGPGGMYPLHPPPIKRALPLDQYTPLGRQLMPKPVTGMSAPSRIVQGPVQPTPLSPLGGHPLSTEPRKKRGRPSKREQEERRLRLSESRIDTSQLTGLMQPLSGPVGRMIQAGPSTELVPGPIPPASIQARPPISTPRASSQPPSSNNSSSSGKKKRGRPPKQPGSVLPAPQFGAGGRVEAYGSIGTPPLTARLEERQESESSSRELPGVSSAPPESTQQRSQAEPEESKPPSAWRDVVFNEQP